MEGEEIEVKAEGEKEAMLATFLGDDVRKMCCTEHTSKELRDFQKLSSNINLLFVCVRA